jgi:hypothetical protein
VLSAAVCGCAGSGESGPTTRPASAYERQEQALQDPFGYKVDASGQDVSGGGITDLDQQGLKRDLDHVLNP